MEPTVKIRKWNENDAESVRSVLQLSWQEAYSSFIPKNDLDFYLDNTYSLELLKDASKKSDFICYVAEIDDTICGWLKLHISKEENRFYLSSIYVLPEYQKLKIGLQFFNLACKEASENGFKEIYIGVMIQNERALNWYRKLGFDFFEEQPFTMGKTSVPHLIGRKILDK
ncbi:MAG: GNAT family N-acetyltransferase [Stygiobacter sp.]|nr:MAG: GNAT family N-acetyltransferase [Stygiobacter sp.]